MRRRSFLMFMGLVPGCAATFAESRSFSRQKGFAIPLSSGAPHIISQGRLYTPEERRLHPSRPHHRGIDFLLPWGTPVYAPADGWAKGSYEVEFVDDDNGEKIGFARGRFVQVYHEGLEYQGKELYSIFMHLSRGSDTIPYYSPVFNPETKDCDTAHIFAVPPQGFKQGAQYVRKGDLVGYAGFTGLLIGDTEVPHDPPLVTANDRSWDRPHLHWELITRDSKTGKRGPGPDPFLIEGDRDAYRDVFTRATGLILVNSDGSPEFAR